MIGHAVSRACACLFFGGFDWFAFFFWAQLASVACISRTPGWLPGVAPSLCSHPSFAYLALSVTGCDLSIGLSLVLPCVSY